MSFYIVDLLFFICISLGSIYNFLGDKNYYIFKIIYLTFIMLSGYYICSNILNYSRDSILYVDWFSRINYSTYSNIVEDGKDILFQFFIKLIQNTISEDSFYIFYIFYIGILYFKLKYVSVVSKGLSLFLLLWLIYSQTFVLYEITQIRGGMAISIVSYAIARDLFEKNKSITYFLYILAPFLHVSTLIIIIIFFILKFLKFKIVNKKTIISMLLFSFIIKFAFDKIVSDSINLYFYNAFRLNSYLDGTYNDVNQTSLFSVLFILKIFFISICLLIWENIKPQEKVFVFLSSLSCCIYMLLSFNSVLALRISELFIFFSLATFILPLTQRFSRVEYKYFIIFIIVGLGFVFCYSSHKILLGY